MEYLILISILVLGVLIGRISFVFVIKRDSNSLSSIKKIFSLHTLHLINAKVGKKIYIKYFLSIFLSCVGGILLYLGVINVLSQNLSNALALIHLIFIVFSFVVVLYLAVYDLVFYEIPIKGLQVFLASSIIFNILAGIVSLSTQSKTFFLGNLSNLFSATLLGLIFFVVVKLTKEKGMGMGDVYLMLAVGLSLGLGRSITAYILTLVLASFAGIILSLFKGKIKHLLIPLVPFIFLGYVISIAMNESLIRVFLPF